MKEVKVGLGVRQGNGSSVQTDRKKGWRKAIVGGGKSSWLSEVVIKAVGGAGNAGLWKNPRANSIFTQQVRVHNSGSGRPQPQRDSQAGMESVIKLIVSLDSHSFSAKKALLKAMLEKNKTAQARRNRENAKRGRTINEQKRTRTQTLASSETRPRPPAWVGKKHQIWISRRREGGEKMTKKKGME